MTHRKRKKSPFRWITFRSKVVLVIAAAILLLSGLLWGRWSSVHCLLQSSVRPGGGHLVMAAFQDDDSADDGSTDGRDNAPTDADREAAHALNVGTVPCPQEKAERREELKIASRTAGGLWLGALASLVFDWGRWRRRRRERNARSARGV